MFKFLAVFFAVFLSGASYADTVTVTEITDNTLPCILDCDKPVGDKPAGNTKPGGDAKPGTDVAKPSASPSPSPAGNGGVIGTTTPVINDKPAKPSRTSVTDVIAGDKGEFIGQLITVGNKIWDFIIKNRPNATYNTLKASVIPTNVASYTELTGWQKPVTKTFRVQFKDLFGRVAGGFDYRITYIYGGNYKGKGKFIAQIAVAPANITLKPDRSVNFKAEILDPVNFGTEEDPVAGVQLLITYNSPTTHKYTMHSAEYFIYGNGEFQKLSNGK